MPGGTAYCALWVVQTLPRHLTQTPSVAMSTTSDSNVSSPLSRGPSPDHGFVLVDDDRGDGQETGALATKVPSSTVVGCSCDSLHKQS